MLNYTVKPGVPFAEEMVRGQEEELARILKSLADPSRLRIFNGLMEGIQCSCEIAEQLGFSPSLISYHLSVMQEVGLVRSERDAKDARWIYYSVDQAMLARLAAAMRYLLDVQRIKPRLPSCGPALPDMLA